MAAPLGSVTVPVTDPVMVCAVATKGTAHRKNTQHSSFVESLCMVRLRPKRFGSQCTSILGALFHFFVQFNARCSFTGIENGIYRTLSSNCNKKIAGRGNCTDKNGLSLMHARGRRFKEIIGCSKGL
jgi:hypothetical protein